jgi:hypothetical protein
MTARRSALETARYRAVPSDSWRVSAIAYFGDGRYCIALSHNDAAGAPPRRAEGVVAVAPPASPSRRDPHG